MMNEHEQLMIDFYATEGQPPMRVDEHGNSFNYSTDPRNRIRLHVAIDEDWRQFKSLGISCNAISLDGICYPQTLMTLIFDKQEVPQFERTRDGSFTTSSASYYGTSKPPADKRKRYREIVREFAAGYLVKYKREIDLLIVNAVMVLVEAYALQITEKEGRVKTLRCIAQRIDGETLYDLRCKALEGLK